MPVGLKLLVGWLDAYTLSWTRFLAAGLLIAPLALRRHGVSSLAAAARILRNRGLDDVLLVSDPFHAYRIRAIAEELGLQAHVSPVKGGATDLERLVEESGAVAIGRVIGFGRLVRLTS